ncbi:MAG: UbiA family prenyltransferase [Nitrososphaerota archaeon]
MRVWDVIALTKSYFSIISVALLTATTSILAGVRSLDTILTILAFFILLTAALNSYNNLMDARSDAVTKRGFPIPAGAVPVSWAVAVAASLYLAAFLMLTRISAINVAAGLILGVDVLLSYLYSAPRVRLKKIPLLKGAVLVSHSLVFPFSAASFIAGNNPLNSLDRLAVTFIMGMAGHTLQDFGDIEGDRMMGDRTLPIVLGVRGGVYATIAIYLLALALAFLVNHTLQAYTLVFLALQAVLSTFLLRDAGLWTIIFKVNAVLSIVTVAAVFYTCCPAS